MTGAPAGRPAAGRAGRRGLALALVVTTAGAVLMLLAAGRPWAVAVITPPSPLPVQRVTPSGAQVVAATRALGLLALAGVAGIVATRGRGRRLVGLVLLAAGVGGLVAAASAGGDRARDAGLVQAKVNTGVTVVTHRRPGWPVVFGVGSVLVAAAGGLAVAGGVRWPALGARYEAPAARARPADPWAELDRGQDPTLR